MSIAWHELRLEDDWNWGRSFATDRVGVCLNFTGQAGFALPSATQDLAAGQMSIYIPRHETLQATRKAGGLHRFITLEITSGYLNSQCGDRVSLLKPAWRAFAEKAEKRAPDLEIAPMSTAILSMRQGLLEPPVPESARETWYGAKAMEVIAHVAFQADEDSPLFCHRHQRQNRERVERARYLLERDLENPPSLEMLAREVGCSPFYLSRIFAEQTGMSIPKFLRTRRIELAASYLREGRMNVTQAAMAVGYSSLSAFNRAFVEQMGCCPGLYPLVKIAGRKPPREPVARPAAARS